MDFTAELGRIKQGVDRELSAQFDRKIREVCKKDAFLGNALEHVKTITLSGGKRLRPALVFCGAGESGQSATEDVLKIACAMELVHCFLLIHDDIIDKGDVRHGIATMNAKYSLIGKENFNIADPEHFGNSVAIILGDFIYPMALELVMQTNLSAQKMCNVVAYLQQIVQNTIVGQSQDIEIECGSSAQKKTVLMMYKNKTSKYSFETPLHVGLMLGSKNDGQTQRVFVDFSNHVGLAFQIQDDIIGVFGETANTGKSAVSDLEQGKKTLLVLETVERLGEGDRKRFVSILGKHNLSRHEISFAKTCMRESGALAYCEKSIHMHLHKGKRIIEKSDVKKATKAFLLGIVDYLDQRQY